MFMTTDFLTPYLRATGDTADLLTVAEACAELRISKWTLYQFIRTRQLASIKLGRRRVIPRTAITTLLEKLTIEAL
jgi:excisionase family DNA binding protein